MSDPDDRIGEALRHDADRSAPRPIDLDAVLAGSRAARRRRRRTIVGGSVTAVALVAIVGIAMGPPLGFGTASISDAPASETATGEAATDASGDRGDDAAPDAVAPQDGPEPGDVALGTLEQATACGRPAPQAASVDGLELVVTSAVLDAEGVGEVTAELSTALGAARTVRISGAPSAMVAADGSVVWLASGAGVEEVVLRPGSPAVISVPVQAADCTAGDEPLAPGAYDVVVVVDVAIDGRVNPVRLVSAAVPVAWAGN
ncbi:hypothetical protein [Agromyces larvae]|uniref:Uncharacterized protein n=1 Tax=Agromyces larvae TaxID=2929802 RepID=A0ABY4BZN3_9MICO|nr:hypothetical protein [Agromyces larvae]UOE44584.1 hypothetical protein MTO99_01970 [Agromyces larvae]